MFHAGCQWKILQGVKYCMLTKSNLALSGWHRVEQRKSHPSQITLKSVCNKWTWMEFPVFCRREEIWVPSVLCGVQQQLFSAGTCGSAFRSWSSCESCRWAYIHTSLLHNSLSDLYHTSNCFLPHLSDVLHTYSHGQKVISYIIGNEDYHDTQVLYEWGETFYRDCTCTPNWAFGLQVQVALDQTWS